MLYCTLTDADGGELWHGPLFEFAAENNDTCWHLQSMLARGPMQFGGGASPVEFLRLDSVRLTRDDMTITELDAAIMVRLADRMAGIRPAWFAPASGSRDDTGPSYLRRQLAQRLLCRYFDQREGYRAAHAADAQCMANMGRWSRADWLPARAVEFVGE